MFFFSGFSICIRAAVTEHTELIKRDTSDFFKNFIWNDHIKCRKSGLIIAVRHKE